MMWIYCKIILCSLCLEAWAILPSEPHSHEQNTGFFTVREQLSKLPTADLRARHQKYKNMLTAMEDVLCKNKNVFVWLIGTYIVLRYQLTQLADRPEYKITEKSFSVIYKRPMKMFTSLTRYVIQLFILPVCIIGSMFILYSLLNAKLGPNLYDQVDFLSGALLYPDVHPARAMASTYRGIIEEVLENRARS